MRRQVLWMQIQGKKPQGKSGGTPKTEAKKTINDYNYYLGSTKQASDYQVTTKFIINHILKTYEYGEDIGQALEEESEALTDMWAPDLQKSTNTDPARMKSSKFYGMPKLMSI
jgi:hypothetical protein